MINYFHDERMLAAVQEKDHVRKISYSPSEAGQV